MPLDALFLISNLAIVPTYVLMVFLPHTKITQRVMKSLWSVAVPALLHLVYSVWLIATDPALLGNMVEAPLHALDSTGRTVYLDPLGVPTLAMAAWLHMLSVDLVMARWVYLDSRKRSIPAWPVSAAIFLISVTGPYGFLLYWLVRSIHRRRTEQSKDI